MSESISEVISKLTQEIKQGLAHPMYLKVERESTGSVAVKQIQFLTPAQLADLTHVSVRTVYGWIEKSPHNGLKFYRPPGTSGVLFEVGETLQWIMSSGVE